MGAMQVPRQLSPGQGGVHGSAQDGGTAVAGTSSFGMSGINAHMLLSAGGQCPHVRLLLLSTPSVLAKTIPEALPECTDAVPTLHNFIEMIDGSIPAMCRWLLTFSGRRAECGRCRCHSTSSKERQAPQPARQSLL